MDVEKMEIINQKILKCPNLNLPHPKCSRDSRAMPLVMEPVQSQRVLLISRDPSNIANSTNTLVGWGNTFFRNHVLEVFFRNYDKRIAKIDISYFNSYRELFHKNVYWTHYSKCYPGKSAAGGHNQPNEICSGKYLSNEIDAFTPECIILMGKHIIELITKQDNLSAIKGNGNNSLVIGGSKVPLICLTHPSNANNKCKRNAEYRYQETVTMIQNFTELHI